MFYPLKRENLNYYALKEKRNSFEFLFLSLYLTDNY